VNWSGCLYYILISLFSSKFSIIIYQKQKNETVGRETVGEVTVLSKPLVCIDFALSLSLYILSSLVVKVCNL